MPLPKQIVRLPITTGLDGKSAPLITAPGSHLQLDNVRMERTGEWRRRHGWHHNPNDDIQISGGVQVVRAVELPGGGILALTEASGDGNTCARLYSPTDPLLRWRVPPQDFGAGVASLSLWSRHQVGYVDNPQPFITFAEGNGLQLTAWSDWTPPTGATMMFKTLGESEAHAAQFQFGGSNARRVRAIYFPGTPGTFMLLWTDGANLVGQTWTGTGSALAGPTTLATDVDTTGLGSCLDALIYPGSTTATVAYQGNAGQAKVLEVAAGLTVSSSAFTGTSGSQCVQLLPNPDGTAFRYIATSTSNLQQLVRMGSTGGIISTNNMTTLATVDSFAGVAVNGGSGVVLVMHTPTGGIWSWKMTLTSNPGTAVEIVPDGTGIYIDSNGWREPGTDAMHFIAGLHIGLPTSPGFTDTDFQHTFYEIAVPYQGSKVSAPVGEPQARLIPLQAGPPAGCERHGTVFAGSQYQVVRTAASSFSVVLPRLVRSDTGRTGQILNPLQYAIDRWDVLHLTGTNAQGVNLGQGVKTSSASYLPAGQLMQAVDGSQIVGHGASAQPYQPTLTPGTSGGGGGLTGGSTYGAVVVTEMIDEAGNLWRSTPSTPAFATLGAGQNQLTVAIKLTPLESQLRLRSVKYYRTLANGSVYFLAWKLSGSPSATTIANFVDLAADTDLGTQLITALSSGDVGEQPATVTPAFTHVVLFDGRLWGIDRDFPTKVWYSKPIAQGTSPEFPASFNFDMPDELGPLTGMAACDDKLVLFKSPRGIYYVPQGGPANDGSGNQYAPVRLSSEVGLLSGQPYVSTGAEVYFGSEQGVYRINGSLGIDFVGMPIDQYLGQPLANTPDTLISATYNGAKNEIRFLGAASQYVFDRLHGLWVRDTFQNASNAPQLMMRLGSSDVMFRSDGTMWTEGTEADLNDPSAIATPYTGVIRSAWFRMAELGGYLRLYGVRVLLDLVGEGNGPQQSLFVYFDDSETPVANPLSPSSVARGQYEARTRAQKCGAFSLELLLASGDVGVRLDGWSAVIGVKAGPQKKTASARWQ